MRLRGLLSTLPGVVVHVAVAAVLVTLLVAVGQPLFTDDLWWHLSMGRRYAAQGPWLDADPFLFLAEAAPTPAAWLADVSFHLTELVGGFQALRAYHVLIVAGTLWVAWSMLRRAGRSWALAALGTGMFAALTAYRLFQLRPHLFSIAAGLLLVWVMVLGRPTLSGGRVAAGLFITALWANLHGAVIVGLVLLAAAACGAGAAAVLGGPGARNEGRRALALFGSTVLCALATFANPLGPGVLTPYFTAGGGTPDLAVVADEWAGIELFATPLSNVPPTPLVWGLVWIFVLAAGLVLVLHAVWWGWVSRKHTASIGPDPALAGVAAASVLGMLSAVRLIWLGFFVLLAVVDVWRVMRGRWTWLPPVRTRRWLMAAAAVCLLPAFVHLGDWSMISQGLSASSYRSPYTTAKYHAHAVWFLRDSGARGNLYADYWLGNFLGYWLAPRMQVFVNGSLNVPKEAMADSLDIRARRSAADGRTTAQQLDQYGVDFFFGTGIPIRPPPGRPPPDTTRHLYDEPGWVLVFRNMQSAILVRDSNENRDNLERIRAYYAERGISFDPRIGFDARAAIREAPGWAEANGVIPGDFSESQRATRAGAPLQRLRGRNRLASLYVLLGRYEEAEALDRRTLESSPGSVLALRRRVWALLLMDRAEEAVEAGQRLAARAGPDDALSSHIALAASRLDTLSDEERAQLRATLPLFTRPQGQNAAAGFRPADPRPAPR